MAALSSYAARQSKLASTPPGPEGAYFGLGRNTRNSSTVSYQPSAMEKPYSKETDSPLAASVTSVAPSKRTVIALNRAGFAGGAFV